ncbi:MAG: SusC/RagA family TonB-linked outer membrane protein [Candidatus Dadabacteria bacterium]
MSRILTVLLGVLMIGSQLLAQNRIISGRVTDAQGNGVPNASVTVKGTNIGTATSNNGDFSLSVPSTARTLVVTSVGFESQEIAIGNRTNIPVSLVSTEQTLTSVVVTVPYGTVRKTAFTGSENTVTSAQITKQQVSSVTRALEGLVPGIIATNGGGQPGTGASILVRGVGSVNASSAPLYVLNGVPYDGSIAAIPTDDVESVTVLKDASAAALYGSRAANGVVMITTKKGKRGAPSVGVTLRQGIMQRGIPEYDRVGPQEYYELFWEAYRNAYIAGGDNPTVAGQKASATVAGPNGLVYNAYSVPASQLIDPVTGKLNPSATLLWNEPWEKALFRNAPRTNATMNVSGATDKSNYYISAGFLNEDGILKFSGYKRYSARVNLNTQATNWLNTGVNLDGAIARRADVPSGGTATTNPFYFTRQMGPIYPVYQHTATGAFVDTLGQHKLDWGTPEQMGTRPYAGRSNLLGSLDLDDRSSDIFNGNINTFAEITFLKYLSLKGTLGVNYYGSEATSYQNNQYGDAAPTPGQNNGGRSTKTNDRQISLTGNEVLTYARNYNNLHNVRFLVGHENYKYRYNYVSANASGFLFPGQTEITNGTQPFTPASSDQQDHTIESYFTGLNYDYQQKYLLSASYRTDGSSRFRDDVRWGHFWSAGAGYRISQEAFMKGIDWLNDLKLRVSYGEQGNEDIGQFYPYRSYYYANGNGTYSAPSRPVNEDLLWETNKTFNIGADFSLFRSRVTGTVEWFNRQSDNLLFDVPLPISTGYSSVWQNIGSMKNYGEELSLGLAAIRSSKFNWKIDVNLTHFNNKITKLPPNQEKNGIVTGTKKLLVGHSIYDFWLREFAGVDASNGDALYYQDIMDANGKPTGERKLTNVINNASYYYFGSALPKLSGGLTNAFNYHGFDLSFLLTFSYGAQFYDGNYASIMHRGSPGTAFSSDILQRWQKPGDVTVVPRLQNAVANQEGASSRWLVDGSYLNVKNITLSYTLSKSLANRLYMDNLQVFANVDNAHLFTAKKGMDPQRVFNGTADATYTPFRTYNLGISVNLK